jgi:hypothetical protein
MMERVKGEKGIAAQPQPHAAQSLLTRTMFTLGTLPWLENLPWQAIPHARFYPSEIFGNSALSSSTPSEFLETQPD